MDPRPGDTNPHGDDDLDTPAAVFAPTATQQLTIVCVALIGHR